MNRRASVQVSRYLLACCRKLGRSKRKQVPCRRPRRTCSTWPSRRRTPARARGAWSVSPSERSWRILRCPLRSRESFSTTPDEEEDEDGRDDVPTPTSSPCLEASDKEDGDIFRGKFGGKEDARTPKPDLKPRHADSSTPLPKPAAAPDFSQKTPSSQINSWPEDVRDMLCTLDDPLLQSLPSTFSAPLASSNDFAVLLPGVLGTCMLLRADFRNVLGILTEEEILTHVDAMDCFLFGDCYMLAT